MITNKELNIKNEILTLANKIIDTESTYHIENIVNSDESNEIEYGYQIQKNNDKYHLVSFRIGTADYNKKEVSLEDVKKMIVDDINAKDHAELDAELEFLKEYYNTISEIING